MIAAWMAWAAAAGLLVAVAARLAESALRLAVRPTRLAWAAALLLGLALPPAAWLQARRGAERPAPSEPAVGASAGAATVADAGALDALLARARVVVSAPPALARLDRPLLAAWALLSGVALLRLLLAGRRLRAARAEWREETVDGVAVLVSGRTGPAVAGIVRPAVVLPEWALASDPALVRLMLAHEREHVRAGDPTLLAAGAVAAALVPWSPGAWLALRGLRLAVEADCDRRVLRRHPDVRRYGGLLLEVGRRLPAADPLPVAALAASRSHLERRIRLMTMSRPRHPLAAGGALAGAAALLVLAACEMPRPTEVSPAGEMPLASIRSGGAYTESGQVTPAAVREAVAAVLKDSDATAALGTPVSLYFVADAGGRVVHAEYSRQRQARGTFTVAPSRGDAADGERAQVRVRLRKEAADGAAAGEYEMRAAPMPGAVASIDPNAIGSIEVLKAKPGDIVADSANVIWVTLKEGATLESARLTGEALRDAQAGRERRMTRERAGTARMAPTPGSAAAGGVRLQMDGSAMKSSLNLASADAPTLVVDGVVVAREKADEFMRDLAPDRIAAVEVVKGEAATRMWGDAGRNGVINVTLKKAP